MPGGLGRYLRNMKFRKKLLLSYLLVVFLPVFIIGYFFIGSVVSETLNQNRYMLKSQFSQTVNSVGSYLGNLVQLSESIKYDNYLTDYLARRYTPGTKYETKYFEYHEVNTTYLKRLAYQHLDGTGFSVYTTNKDILCFNDFVYYTSDAAAGSAWYGQALETAGSSHVCSPVPLNGGYAIPLTTQLTPGKNITNILRIDIPEKKLYSLIDTEPSSGAVYILNKDFCIITSTDRNSVSRNFSETAWRSLMPAISAAKGIVTIDRNKNTICVGAVDAVDGGEFWVVGIYPTGPVTSQLFHITAFSLGICVLVACADILFILLFSRQFTSKILNLVSAVRTVREGNLTINVSSKGDDEISELAKSFQEMMDRINTLINKVYLSELQIKDTEIKARKAEIHALQSQINPHFLFNTLDSINTSVLKNNDLASSDMIVSLSKLIRKSIKWKNDNIPLKYEIEMVEDYLKIQRFRHREKLQYRIAMEDGLGEIVVPRFILQPLVENTVCHGIEAKKGAVMVEITCTSEGSDLKVTVSDNGAGIPEEQLNSIRNKLDHWKDYADDDQIGMMNVHQRLKLNFGEAYGVTVDSHLGSGSSISILLPTGASLPVRAGQK